MNKPDADAGHLPRADLSGDQFGLQYYAGERVRVSFGRLKPNFWQEHSNKWTRLIITFHSGSGRIETAMFGVPRQFSKDVGANSLCLVPQDVEITFEWARTAELLILHLNPDVFGAEEPPPWRFYVEDFSGIARARPCLAPMSQVFWAFCSETCRPDLDVVESAGFALARVIMEQAHGMESTSLPCRSALSSEVLREITEYVDTRTIGSVSLRDLARIAKMSPDHFARRFKVATRVSPKQFILVRGVEKARRLILTGTVNVSEAADACGFYDPSHLNRCFRKFYKTSPGAVLKNSLPPVSYP